MTVIFTLFKNNKTTKQARLRGSWTFHYYFTIDHKRIWHWPFYDTHGYGRRNLPLKISLSILKSIFYKIDIGKSFMSKIPLFLPRFFVNIIYQKRPQYQLFSVHSQRGRRSKVPKIVRKIETDAIKFFSIVTIHLFTQY